MLSDAEKIHWNIPSMKILTTSTPMICPSCSPPLSFRHDSNESNDNKEEKATSIFFSATITEYIINVGEGKPNNAKVNTN